jgi:hypothetical protein
VHPDADQSDLALARGGAGFRPVFAAGVEPYTQRTVNVLGDAFFRDLGLTHCQGEESNLAGERHDERAVTGHHTKRGVACSSAAGNQHRLVRCGHSVAEHVGLLADSCRWSGNLRCEIHNVHGSTRTVRAPRISITNTSVPLGRGLLGQDLIDLIALDVRHRLLAALRQAAPAMLPVIEATTKTRSASSQQTTSSPHLSARSTRYRTLPHALGCACRLRVRTQALDT